MATEDCTLSRDREGGQGGVVLDGGAPALGIAVMTWHKGFKGEDSPEGEFCTVTVPVLLPGGPRSAEVRLAGKRISLARESEVRQIRRLLDNGRQVPAGVM